MQSDFTVSDVLERLKTDKVFFREFMEAIVELIDLLKDRKTARREKESLGISGAFNGCIINDLYQALNLIVKICTKRKINFILQS